MKPFSKVSPVTNSTDKMAMVVGAPPGLHGVGGFGGDGQAKHNYEHMVKGMTRLTETEKNVEHDAVNSDKYIKELSKRSTSGSSTKSQWLGVAAE